MLKLVVSAVLLARCTTWFSR